MQGETSSRGSGVGSECAMDYTSEFTMNEVTKFFAKLPVSFIVKSPTSFIVKLLTDWLLNSFGVWSKFPLHQHGSTANNDCKVFSCNVFSNWILTEFFIQTCFC